MDLVRILILLWSIILFLLFIGLENRVIKLSEKIENLRIKDYCLGVKIAVHKYKIERLEQIEKEV